MVKTACMASTARGANRSSSLSGQHENMIVENMDLRRDDLGRHGSLCDIDKGVSTELVDLGR
jgi:hypothetical protein